MKSLLASSALLLLFNFSFAQSDHFKGQVMVELADGKSINSLLEKKFTVEGTPFQFSINQNLSQNLNIWLLNFNEQLNDELVLETLRREREIKIAQFNHYISDRAIPDDSLYPDQWNWNNTGNQVLGSIAGDDVQAEQAWNISTGGLTAQGDTIVVAVIDCGFDLAQEDLNFWKNYAEIPNNTIDDDGNGYVDDFDGWDTKDNDGILQSCNHGTHVCGIVGAIGNNHKGVTGVNWNVKIMPVRGSSTTESVVVAAYSYVYKMRKLYNQSNGLHGAFIVATNSSFGVNFGHAINFPIWCAMYDSLGSLGILNAGAGPNQSINVDVQGDIPTTCTSDWLIGVTNTTSSDDLSTGAGFGDVSIDLGAPGTSILSTYPNNTYSYSSGTSMASPHVAGAVALMWAAACNQMIIDYKNYPAQMALMMKNYLLSSVDSIAALDGLVLSGGRLNLFKSLLAVVAHDCSIPFGIDENKSLTDIFIFPNPTHHNLNIVFKNISDNSIHVSIFNVLGQELLSKSFQNSFSNHLQNEKLDMSPLCSGIYFITLSNGISSHTEKIVVE